MDEPTDRGSVGYSARLTVRAHDAGRRCHLGCRGRDDCPQLDWARRALAEQRTPRPTPTDDRPHTAAG